MDGILQELLALVLLYGYPAVAGAELLSAAGVPLPMSAILLLSGSLAAVGSLNLVALFLLVAAASVAGDCLDFFIGRRLGPGAVEKLERLPFVSNGATSRAQAYLARWSGAGIFFSRWLFTPLGSVISLLSGMTGYPLRSFLIVDITGELLAAAVWLGSGYAFGANWQEISTYLGSLPGEATAVITALLLIALGVRRLTKR